MDMDPWQDDRTEIERCAGRIREIHEHELGRAEQGQNRFRYLIESLVRRLRTAVVRQTELDAEIRAIEWAADRCAEELAARESKPLKRVHRRLLDQAERLRATLRRQK